MGQPRHAEEVDDRAACEKSGDGRGNGAILLALGEIADEPGGDDEADQVAAGCSLGVLPAGFSSLVEGKEEAQDHVKPLTGRAEAGPEGGSTQQHDEGLAGDVDRREPERDPDLRRQRRQQGKSNDESGTDHLRAR